MISTRPLIGVIAFAASMLAPRLLCAQPTYRVVGYLAGWSDRYGPADVPGNLLTHVNYAFAVIRDGKCTVKDLDNEKKKFAGLRELKQKYPHLRTLISVGGWTDSSEFSDAALTAASREKFARSCAAFAHEHGFDGVDIDWEYPGGGGMDKTAGRPEDMKNFTLLLAELRRQLDMQGRIDRKPYLLTIAAPASARQAKRIEVEQISRSLDFINLMTYDFAGSWSPKTTFNAPLYGQDKDNDDACVRDYLERGVPAGKLVLGVPFFGRGWAGVKNINNGLDQPHDEKPPPKENGEWKYHAMVERYVGKIGQRFWSDQAKVPWLFDAKSGLFVTYDDPESIRLKAEYARDHKLGGVMTWELSEDDTKASLLNAINAGLAPSAPAKH